MRLVLFTLATLCISASALTGFDGPCKEQRKALRESHKAVKDCNKAWHDSVRGDSPDPSDDCSAKQAEFVANVKSVKECRKIAKAKEGQKK
ncbi:hypothetical protein K2X33_03925 [bacterium]|nr:hypothetical protein [bacterium]